MPVYCQFIYPCANVKAPPVKKRKTGGAEELDDEPYESEEGDVTLEVTPGDHSHRRTKKKDPLEDIINKGRTI